MNTGKQINAMIALLLLLLLSVGIYTVWDPFRAEAEAERTQERIAERAAHQFARNCRTCHGNAGEGRIGPALDPEVRRQDPTRIDFADPTKLKENQLYVKNILQCGKIGTIMPPWSQEQGGSLNDEQIRQLTVLITQPPRDAWKHVKEISEEEDKLVPLPPVQEITAGAIPTGSTGPVCGQRAPTQAEETGPVEVKAEWEIDMLDNRFQPRRIGVPPNTPVTLNAVNKGQALHNVHVQNVRSTNGQEIVTALLPGGRSERITFTIAQPGNYTFICDVHPVEMRGTLVVQAP
jgi:plastocyanin/mono/diheme cytochrome c family protein